MSKNSTRIFQIVGMGILIALVIVLQFLGGFIHFGTFSISLVLVPIVIGASLFGWQCGAILGLVFAGMVFATGDATTFLAINVFGTIVTVVLKGVLAGLIAGLVYKALSKVNEIFATFVAAIVCPIVNTGVFLIGCYIFFLPTITEWAGGQNIFSFMILGLVGANFLFELAFNLVLSPAIIQIVKIIKKPRNI